MGALFASLAAAAASVPVLAGCVLFGTEGASPQADWALHTVSRPGYDYHVEYPRSWAVEEDAVATRFRPPDTDASEPGITIVVIDYSETPPPPVPYTYTTVRVIDEGGRTIPVEHRDPSPATEAYLVRMQEGRYTAEIRFALSDAHAAVFDHVVLSFFLSPKPR